MCFCVCFIFNLFGLRFSNVFVFFKGFECFLPCFLGFGVVFCCSCLVILSGNQQSASLGG